MRIRWGALCGVALPHKEKKYIFNFLKPSAASKAIGAETKWRNMTNYSFLASKIRGKKLINLEA